MQSRGGGKVARHARRAHDHAAAPVLSFGWLGEWVNLFDRTLHVRSCIQAPSFRLAWNPSTWRVQTLLSCMGCRGRPALIACTRDADARGQHPFCAWSPPPPFCARLLLQHSYYSCLALIHVC